MRSEEVEKAIKNHILFKDSLEKVICLGEEKIEIEDVEEAREDVTTLLDYIETLEEKLNIKKLIGIITIILMCLVILTGCTSESNAKDQERFVKISMGNVYIYYDTQTKVQYAMMNNGHGGTSLTLLVDAEGKPLLYEGE